MHRALSPETVAVTSAGGWKLAGGLSHAASTRGESGDAMFHLDTAHAALSKNGVPLDPLPLMPKLAYLAPELVLGAGGNGVSAGEPTPASDVFSLGAMFFELLAGRKWLEIPELSQTVGSTAVRWPRRASGRVRVRGRAGGGRRMRRRRR